MFAGFRYKVKKKDPIGDYTMNLSASTDATNATEAWSGEKQSHFEVVKDKKGKKKP